MSPAPLPRRLVHDAAIGLSGALFRLIPDRVPVTFVGNDATAELCEAVAHTGARKLLVVSDAQLVSLGLVRRLTDALDAVGLAWSLYDGVEPDPTFEQVEAGLAVQGREGCDAVLAFGGGSPMDAAKVIAAAATNGGDATRLEGRFKVRRPTLPLYAVPTTAGTGSEVTLAAVVSDSATHTKKFFVDPKLLPSMAALDPTLMTGLPPAVTAATGMDALTHAVESYLARTANDQTRAWARTAVRLVFENLATACTDGNDLAARKGMALAAYYAGLAFTRTSVGYVHAIAHGFGAFYGTPHGWANAIALPAVLDFSLEAARPQLADLADAIGLVAKGEEAKARAFVGAVRDLKAKVEIPESLEALRADDVPRLASQAVEEAHANYPVPSTMSQEECEALLRSLLP